MARKRCLEVSCMHDFDCSRPLKRAKTSHVLCCMATDACNQAQAEFPMQRQLDLGPFWATSGNLASCKQPCPAVERDFSLGSWHQGVSLSLRSHRSCADAEDEETQDTATSSDSLGDTPGGGCLHRQRSHTLLPRVPDAAAAGEEDSITSNQPPVPASAAFSFGDRPYVTPDLAAVQCWDL